MVPAKLRMKSNRKCMSFIKTRLMKCTSYSKNEEKSFTLVQKYWSELPQSYFQNLVNPIPYRTAPVLASGVIRIKYSVFWLVDYW